MAREVWVCGCCGEVVSVTEPLCWVRRKGRIYYYHKRCLKGGGKV